MGVNRVTHNKRGLGTPLRSSLVQHGLGFESLASVYTHRAPVSIHNRLSHQFKALKERAIGSFLSEHEIDYDYNLASSQMNNGAFLK